MAELLLAAVMFLMGAAVQDSMEFPYEDGSITAVTHCLEAVYVDGVRVPVGETDCHPEQDMWAQ